MINFERFTEQEIPYDILGKFGLTQEMIDDLPQNVMQRLLSSRWTPVLPIITEDENGEKHRSMARISLVRKSDGTVDVSFAPYCGFDNMGNYTEEEQEQLKGGVVLIKDIKDKDDIMTKCYVQFDFAVQQNMYVPVLIIQQNISILADRMGLDQTDIELLQDAEILELSYNGQTASVGIDLYDRTGLRCANGDRNIWLGEAFSSENMPQYNFGMNGCWVADENGGLDYVSEENYDDDILAELKRRGMRNAANTQMRMG